MKKRGFGVLIFYVAVFCLGLYILSSMGSEGIFGNSTSSVARISYSQLTNYIEEDQVSSLTIQMGTNSTCYVKGVLKNDKGGIITYAPYNDLINVLNEHNANSTTKIDASYAILTQSDYTSIIMIVLTVLSMGFLFFFIMSQSAGNGGGKMMNFGKSKAVMFSGGETKVSFEDVAGAEEEKQELAEIVDFLKYPDKYERSGAKVPKGVLLVGQPGTGKTLLAKATAGEAGVPFFTISGSDFVEMFVGVGASRVRDLFDTAKKNAPCIVFIDEIDAVGRQRGAGLGGGNDEREQTLNQLLVEMDGFTERQGIIVIAATNRPDILDPALTRPGRFDRQVSVNPPDLLGREQVLLVHSKNKTLGEDVDLKALAKLTIGFTGADLSNVMNEAALLAARDSRVEIHTKDLDEAVKRVIAGPEKKSKLVTEDDRRVTAVHETGHAVVIAALPECRDFVQGVTIVQRGNAAGITFHLRKDDNEHVSKKYLLSQITIAMGGRAAEAVLLDDICTGASGDMQQATSIARGMVTSWGMSDKIGMVSYSDDSDNVFIGRDMMRSKSYSEQVAQLIDSEIKDIISECYEKAVDIITKNKDKIEIIVSELLKKESLTGEEFMAIYEGKAMEAEPIEVIEASSEITVE